MFEEKRKILEELLGEYKHSGNELLFYCPFCSHHKQKFSINLLKNVFKCWVCEAKASSLFPLIKRFGTPAHISFWLQIEQTIDFSLTEYKRQEDIKLPEKYFPLITPKVHPLSVQARHYLKSRGLTTRDIYKWKIGYCVEGEFKNRVIFPSFNLKGDLDFFVARTYDQHGFPPYLHPKEANKDLIFNELFISWDDDIVLVEGIFDAVVAQNAIPLLGSTLRENSHIFQEMVLKKDKVFIALDPDAKKKENAIIKMFMQYGIEVFKVVVEPFKDVAEMSKNEFMLRKQNAINKNEETLERRIMMFNE